MDALVLNSAHSKYPIGSDPWIQTTTKAVKNLAERDLTLLCSTDPTPWDLVTYLAGECGMHVKLIVKSADDDAGDREYRHLLSEFNLDDTRTNPLFLGYHFPGRPKKTWPLRDSFAFDKADVVYPVSIRPGGRLDSLLSDRGFNVEIRNDFRIEWSIRRHSVNNNYAFKKTNPFPPGNWLVHWTSRSQGPWPGEKAWEFYHDLLMNPDSYVRSAEETLLRIIRDGLIRGSSAHLPAGETAVAFTALEPGEAVQLMRWRKRFVRYSFEPYGIGIRKKVVAAMGGRRVSYENGSLVQKPGEKLFSHSPGKQGNWVKEQEWRIRSDVSLGTSDKDDKIIIVPDSSSADRIRNWVGDAYIIHVLFRE